MIRHSLFLCLWLFPGCGLQQRIGRSLDRREQHHQWLLYTDSSSQEQQNVQLSLNTGDEQLQVDLMPLGPFQYHPEQGFKGSAGQLRIKRLYRKLSVTSDSGGTRITQTNQYRQQTDRQQRERYQEKVVHKAYRNWRSYGLLFVAIVILLSYYLLRRYWFRLK